MRTDERAQLTLWADAFNAVYGWRPVFTDITGDVPDAFAITLRPEVEPIELLGSTGHFRHRPALVEHVTRMGFGWTDANRIVTAPSPASFNALADRRCPAGDGYRARYHRDDQRNLALGPFLVSYLEGFVPLHLASERFYAALVKNPAAPTGRGDLRFHFASFGHDMTVHALNYHLIPRASIERFARRIDEAMPERVRTWRSLDAVGPLTLTTFFDNDINRYSYAVWSRTERPADFARTFSIERNHAALMDCLALRIDETLRGLGDVPSGDVRDMEPLTRYEFDLRF